jgi:hypothetical protein
MASIDGLLTTRGRSLQEWIWDMFQKSSPSPPLLLTGRMRHRQERGGVSTTGGVGGERCLKISWGRIVYRVLGAIANGRWHHLQRRKRYKGRWRKIILWKIQKNRHVHLHTPTPIRLVQGTPWCKKKKRRSYRGQALDKGVSWISNPSKCQYIENGGAKKGSLNEGWGMVICSIFSING